jgi:hypothetical protein
MDVAWNLDVLHDMLVEGSESVAAHQVCCVLITGLMSLCNDVRFRVFSVSCKIHAACV